MGGVSGTGPGAAVICASGWRASFDSPNASIKIVDTTNRTIMSLTARMRSPSVNPNEPRRRTKVRDKAGGLGYNRDLIGAVQALRIDTGRADSILSAEMQCAIQMCGTDVAIDAAGEWDKEVP
jgi:hypothetical protein